MNIKNIFDYDNRFFWITKGTEDWKWFVGYNLQVFLEERWDREVRQRDRERAEESEKYRIRAEEEYIRENPHLVMLEQLPEEEGRETALQLIDIHYRCESEVRKAYLKACEEKMALFRELTDMELPEDRILNMEGLYFAEKAFKGSIVQLEQTFLDNADNVSPEVEGIVNSLLPDFEEIALMDDRSIQRLLREVDTGMLARALILASEAAQDRIYSNMSARAAELLIEDMSFMGPVFVSLIIEAQKAISNEISRLILSGEINSPSREQ